MIYKQTTPMQRITFYYIGDKEGKIKKAKNRQMTKKIRYSNVIEEVREEGMRILSDSKKHLVGITNNDLIVMFENNISHF